VLTTDTVHLSGPPPDPTRSFPVYPTYAEFRPNVDTSKYTSISIDVDPITPNVLLWAFSTTTDSKTEAVTAVFPAK